MFCSIHSTATHKSYLERLKVEYGDTIDNTITNVGKNIITKTYCSPGETVADRLLNACVAFSSDFCHAGMVAHQISTGQFMFATPLLANAGASRGLPISCFLNYVDDSLESMGKLYAENIHLSAMGGGIGTHWSAVRSNGTATSKGSETTGVIPFMHVQDAQALAFNQGKTRRGAHAVYLDISHPEIYEFLSMRSPEGDLNRKNLHLHQGVNIPDTFMRALDNDDSWGLVDPHTGITTQVVKARHLWGAVLSARMSNRGEPYIIFTDAVEDNTQYKDFSCNGSNLCTEIFLKTSEDLTAVCCLSSINIPVYATLNNKKRNQLALSMVEMLDNALTVFTSSAPNTMLRAVTSVFKERSIGIGAMGVHSYLQTFGYDERCSTNLIDMFKHIDKDTKQASEFLVSGDSKCIPDEAKHLNRRNTHLTAIAPNSTSSLMLGVSPGVEPYRANVYTIKQGGVVAEIINPHLVRVLASHNLVEGMQEYDEVLDSIRANNGSAQHIHWFTDDDRFSLRTAVEHDQIKQVTLVGNIQPYIHQGISLNLFFRADESSKLINEVHTHAWLSDIKSLYYCRVEINDRVEAVSTSTTCDIDNKDECLACQG